MKYHKTNPIEKLHPGEPWFFIRSTDRFAPAAVQAYATMLGANGDKDGAAECMAISHEIIQWQKANPDKVKHPD